MRIETKNIYIAFDETQFSSQEECEKYESEKTKWIQLVESKIGKFDPEELVINYALTLNELPCVAPWLSPFGACFIKISDIRRSDEGCVEFQLADENNVPYENGTLWAKKEAFYGEWPD